MRFAANLRKGRENAGYTSAAQAARAMGIGVSGYNHHENGQRGIDLEAAKFYASFLAIKVNDLIDLDYVFSPEAADFAIPVTGEVAMGIWRSAELDSGEHTVNKRTIDVPRVRGSQMRLSVEVADESVNKSIRRGEYAIYIPLDVALSELNKKLIIIERIRNGLIERSIRRATVTGNGTLSLAADTTDKRFNKDVVLYPASGADDDVRIIGRVIGKYVESDKL